VDAGASVTVAHMIVSASRNSSRVGRWLLALILLARTVAFDAACAPSGPPAGAQGGRCKPASSCGAEPGCDIGLECDDQTNTCRQSSGLSYPGSSCDGYCYGDTSIACKPGQQGFNCCGGLSPGTYRCTATSPNNYCCDVDPTCVAEQGMCGGTYYECIGAAQPDGGVSGCFLGSYGVVQWYCCAPPGSCFVAPNDVSFLHPCVASETVVVCAGGAPPQPPGTTCSASTFPLEGDVETYCCSSGDDGGGDAASGDDGGSDSAAE
jgi:hypothetical protein